MNLFNPNNSIDRIIAYWQAEDLLRAFSFEIELLKSAKGIDESAAAFFEIIRDDLFKEGKKEIGHCQKSLDLIEPLAKAHKTLINESLAYQELYESIENQITNFNKARADSLPSTTVMFELFYAFYLQKISKKDTTETIENLGQVLGTCLNLLNEKAGA